MPEPDLKDIARRITAGEISRGIAAVEYSLTAPQIARLSRLLTSMENDVKAELIENMRTAPQNYYPQVMRNILNHNLSDPSLYTGIPGPLSRFVETGETIEWNDLLEGGVIPRGFTPDMVISDEDMRLPVYSLKEYSGGIVDDHRTDVFLLGIAGCGKSTLACSLIRQFADSCDYEYQPLKNHADEPKTSEYFKSAMEITKRGFHKPVAPTLAGNLLVCQLRHRNSRRRLTMIDGDSSVMADVAKLHSRGQDTMKEETVYRILSNDNSKILLFLLDYGLIKAGRQRTLFRQSIMIESVLNSLGNDGTGSDPKKGCTYSKVKGIGFVITKCDPGEADSERIINRFFDEQMKTVMMRIDVMNRAYGVNKEMDYKPFIKPVTLGNFTVGNAFVHDPRTSRELAEMISNLTPTQWPWHC